MAVLTVPSRIQVRLSPPPYVRIFFGALFYSSPFILISYPCHGLRDGPRVTSKCVICTRVPSPHLCSVNAKRTPFKFQLVLMVPFDERCFSSEWSNALCPAWFSYANTSFLSVFVLFHTHTPLSSHLYCLLCGTGMTLISHVYHGLVDVCICVSNVLRSSHHRFRTVYLFMLPTAATDCITSLSVLSVFHCPLPKYGYFESTNDRVLVKKTRKNCKCTFRPTGTVT